jgi:hypothetical protein
MQELLLDDAQRNALFSIEDNFTHKISFFVTKMYNIFHVSKQCNL